MWDGWWCGSLNAHKQTVDFSWGERKREYKGQGKKLNDAEQAFNRQQSQLNTATNNTKLLQNDLSALKAQHEELNTKLAQTVAKTDQLMEWNNGFVVDLVEAVDNLKNQVAELQANKRQRTQGGFGATDASI